MPEKGLIVEGSFPLHFITITPSVLGYLITHLELETSFPCIKGKSTGLSGSAVSTQRAAVKSRVRTTAAQEEILSRIRVLYVCHKHTCRSN